MPSNVRAIMRLTQRRLRHLRTCVETRAGAFPMASVRGFFHWKYSGILIFFFWGMVLALAGIGVAVEPFVYLFWLARIFALFAFVWSICFWLTSNELEGRKPKITKKQRKNKEKVSLTGYQMWKWGGSALIAIVFFGSIELVNTIQLGKELSINRGWLEPDTLPTPDNACSGFNKSTMQFMTLLLGDNAVYADSFPHTVLMVRGKEELVLDKDEKGRIAVTVDIFDKDGKVVANFDHGAFQVNKSNVSKIERPDLHTLIVTDEYKNEALYVHYLNKNTLQMGGRLYYTSLLREPIVIPKEIYPGTCRGRNIPADIIVP